MLIICENKLFYTQIIHNITIRKKKNGYKDCYKEAGCCKEARCC